MRHFDIDGSVCVSEWVESCEFDVGWEKTAGCSAKAQTCVSGLDGDSTVTLDSPDCLKLTVAQDECTCPEDVVSET